MHMYYASQIVRLQQAAPVSILRCNMLLALVLLSLLLLLSPLLSLLPLPPPCMLSATPSNLYSFFGK